MFDIIGEIAVEVIAYGTFGFVKKILEYIPVKWNPKVLKVLCVLISILLWFFVFYIGIKIAESIL